MTYSKKAAFLLAAGLGTASLMLPAYAAEQQGAAPQQGMDQPQQQTQQAEPVSDQELKQFVVAVSNVQAVQQQYAQELQNAEDQSKAQALRQEAQQSMVEAVQETGMTVPEYNQLAQRVQNDPSLIQRLNELAPGS